MKNGRIKRAGSILFVMTFLLIGCGKADQAEKNTVSAGKEQEIEKQNDTEKDVAQDAVTIRVGVNSGDQNQVLKIIDKHTGLFSNKGINFETTDFANGINTIDAIELGQLDIGLFADYAGINRFGNTIGNTELKAFTQFYVSDKSFLYVNPEHISKPEDLYTASLISCAGVVYEYYYGKLFDKYGIDASKITLKNVSSVQEALALASQGTGDAFWANAQTKSMFEQYGWKEYVSIGDIGATQYAFLVAKDSYLKEHQEDVVRFLETSEEGIDYINEHLDEVAQWVEDETGLDKDLYISSWKGIEHGFGFTEEAYEDLNEVKTWCYENGKFDTDFNVSDFINTDALEALEPDKVTWKNE